MNPKWIQDESKMNPKRNIFNCIQDNFKIIQDESKKNPRWIQEELILIISNMNSKWIQDESKMNPRWI